jgi:hypothetical protein
MISPVLSGCFHCRRHGHWQGNCPLLQPPGDKDHHEARIATIRMWFLEFEISPLDKARLIKHENELWKDVQRKVKK